MNLLQEKWERRATVRSRPRVVYDKVATGYYYPLSRAPLAIHPSVILKGEKAIEFLLIQSLYKYSNDIASIETRVVNETILKAISDKIEGVSFDEEQKINLYTIMVDEAYHAYVAFDSIIQIKEETGINPLPLPQTIEIEKAISAIKKKLDIKYHSVFEFICVCLAENTLTKEIVTMTDKEETHPYFQKIIKDHLLDETRHSGIFFKLLCYVWSNLNEEFKQNIGEVLAEFIELYLDLDVQVEFDRKILKSINLTDQEIEEAIKDTYASFKLNKEHPMLKNILTILHKTEVIDDYTSVGFKQRNWI
ncbi:diiron oxygenase [Francisella philomiragia]|uniref:diiron oxygenase n=1 Tax=Francisella philomiragia TaxID=28110 RepID=UPI001909012E|nr:diiron oxygenase [Francisella philomiragia]MBK2296725.1 diiron oxygenase [Francisella philomiragia]MBK2341462.1 diiron oxygenase [Francisella philomiragia]